MAIGNTPPTPQASFVENVSFFWLHVKPYTSKCTNLITIAAKAISSTLIGFAAFLKESRQGRGIPMPLAGFFLTCNFQYIAWTRHMNLVQQPKDLLIMAMSQPERQKALAKINDPELGFFAKLWQGIQCYVMGIDNPEKLGIVFRGIIAMCLGMAMVSAVFDFISVVMGVLRFSDSGLHLSGLVLASSRCAQDVPNSCWKGLLVATVFGALSSYQFLLYRVTPVMGALSLMFNMAKQTLAMQKKKFDLGLLSLPLPAFKSVKQAVAFMGAMCLVFGNAFAYGMQNSWFTQDGIEEFVGACQLAAGYTTTLSKQWVTAARDLGTLAMINGIGLSVANSSEILNFKPAYLKELYRLLRYNKLKAMYLILIAMATTSILLLQTRTGFDSKGWLYVQDDTPVLTSLLYGIGRGYCYLSQGLPHFLFNLRRALKTEDVEITAINKIKKTVQSIPKYQKSSNSFERQEDALTEVVFNRKGDLILHFSGGKHGRQLRDDLAENIWCREAECQASDAKPLLADCPEPIVVPHIKDDIGGSRASLSGQSLFNGKQRFYDYLSSQAEQALKAVV